jgi:hypothetical protein
MHFIFSRIFVWGMLESISPVVKGARLCKSSGYTPDVKMLKTRALNGIDGKELTCRVMVSGSPKGFPFLT